MTIVELKSKIILDQIPDIMIFTGSELEVINFFVKKIQEKLNYRVHKMDSMVDVVRLSSGNSIFKTKKLFIVSDDEDFLKSGKWENLYNLIGDNKLILKYHNHDSRLSFWKNFEKETVVFERMSNKVVANHLSKDFNLSVDYCSLLANKCDNDYFKCKMELDKVINYAKAKNITNEDAFTICAKNVLCFNKENDIFEFVKFVLVRDYHSAISLYNEMKRDGEAPLKILSLLYTNFKNVLISQTISSGKNIQQNAGINYYSYVKAKEVSGHYTNEEIEFILQEIMRLEQGIKTGKIDSSMTIDFLFSVL